MLIRKPPTRNGRPVFSASESEKRLRCVQEIVIAEHQRAAKNGDELLETALLDTRLAVNEAIAVVRRRGR